MLDFTQFFPILPKSSCTSSGNPKLCQLFCDFSVPTFSSAFSLLRPRAPELGWADFLPFPSCSSSSTASCGVSNLPQNIFAVANPFFFSQGLIPACRMEPQDHAEALGFRFILRAVLLLVWNWGFFVLGKVFFLSQGTRRKHMAMWEVGKNSGLWSKLFLLTSVSPLGEGKGGKRP